MIERMVPALYVDNPAATKDFYRELLGLEVAFEAEWIVQLADPANEVVELILQPRTHELIPADFRKSPRGGSIAFVVADCDEYYKKALSLKLRVIREPRNEEYGQRRFLTVDPDGLLIDVSSSCAPSPEFMARYFGSTRA